MLCEDSQFRRFAETIADTIRHSEELDGRKDVTVIVEDKGAIENIIANALSVGGICIIIGVTGFSRKGDSGPVILGDVSFEFRVIERPAVNRNTQGFLTTQEMTEYLIGQFHWRNVEGMTSPLLFRDFQRDDSDFFNIARMNFTGECSLGMVVTQ